MRRIIGKLKNDQMHWVGDGFPVRNLFSYDRLGQNISPFLLLDYAAPYHFDPTNDQRGVGSHPHRGFETVTIAYQGEVTHKDSSGGGGIIKTGDVQWMTAASGLVHEEFHSQEYAHSGGIFEMVQLWVNLPSHAKMTAPKYQAIDAQAIPTVALDEQGSHLRVIAGEYLDTKGTATTFTPINMWDGEFKANTEHHFFMPVSHNAMLVVLSGEVTVNHDQTADASTLILFAKDGESQVHIQAAKDSKFLVLTGEPLNEPIEGYGPFVMNTKQEIMQAFDDFNQGKFGEIAAQ